MHVECDHIRDTPYKEVSRGCSDVVYSDIIVHLHAGGSLMKYLYIRMFYCVSLGPLPPPSNGLEVCTDTYCM